MWRNLFGGGNHSRELVSVDPDYSASGFIIYKGQRPYLWSLCVTAEGAWNTVMASYKKTQDELMNDGCHCAKVNIEVVD